MINRRNISRIIVQGDSLSDRGTTYKRGVGCLPIMSWLSGLAGRSPDGSFTNGYVWTDHFLAEIANEFIINKLKQEKKYRNDDIADSIINHERDVMCARQCFYNLDNDLKVNYLGYTFARTYTEGGLAAHNYRWLPSSSLSRFFTRLILPTLEEKFDKIKEDDKKAKLTAQDKADTLIIEWSGANDLITVNERPSIAEADRAIAARIKNIEALVKQGYQNFVLFNLPDLSLVPRFQAASADERNNAHQCSVYFNTKLQEACTSLQAKYPNCQIDVFDANAEFNNMLNNPRQYKLDPSKLHTPYTKSKDFKMRKDGTSPSEGYPFWDDVHPTADVHAQLALKFREKYTKLYNFIPPTQLNQTQHKLHSSQSMTNLHNNKATLFQAHNHASPVKPKALIAESHKGKERKSIGQH